jgi:hypothetical protein
MSSSEYFLGSSIVHSHAGYSSSASATTGAWPFNHANPGITVSLGQLLATVIMNQNKARQGKATGMLMVLPAAVVLDPGVSVPEPVVA